MRCVILQPSFIPWRGYFDQIRRADCFVFYDDVQYDKHGWRNRNRIKTASGTHWLTVPVFKKGAVSSGLRILDAAIRWDPDWSGKHLETIRQAYARAPYFDRYFALIAEAYAARPQRLVDLTIPLTLRLAKELKIEGTRFLRSSELGIEGSRSARLVEILRHLGATRYLSGPSARDYLDEDLFRAAGIEVEFMSYAYPEYAQLYPPFDSHVSVLDLLFVAGDSAPRFIWEDA